MSSPFPSVHWLPKSILVCYLLPISGKAEEGATSWRNHTQHRAPRIEGLDYLVQDISIVFLCFTLLLIGFWLCPNHKAATKEIYCGCVHNGWFLENCFEAGFRAAGYCSHFTVHFCYVQLLIVIIRKGIIWDAHMQSWRSCYRSFLNGSKCDTALRLLKKIVTLWRWMYLRVSRSYIIFSLTSCFTLMPIPPRLQT